MVYQLLGTFAAIHASCGGGPCFDLPRVLFDAVPSVMCALLQRIEFPSSF